MSDDWDDELDDPPEEDGTAILGGSRLLAASPTAVRSFLLALVGKSAGSLYRLDGQLVIGRSEDAGARLLDEGVSRRHARVFSRGGMPWIEDLGATNGTKVNDTRIEDAVPLKDGDKVWIGGACLLHFTLPVELDGRFQGHLFESAVRDLVTGAYRLRILMERLDGELAYAVRHRSFVSLLVAEIDDFASLARTYGRDAANHVLLTFAAHAQESIRREDLLAQGEEEGIFVLLCRGASDEEASRFAERLREKTERWVFTFESRLIPVRVSVGVADAPRPGVGTPAELLGAARAALGEAQRLGGNRVAQAPKSPT